MKFSPPATFRLGPLLKPTSSASVRNADRSPATGHLCQFARGYLISLRAQDKGMRVGGTRGAVFIGGIKRGRSLAVIRENLIASEL
jgi:hypothetical protein